MAVTRHPPAGAAEPVAPFRYASLSLRIVAFILDLMVLISAWIILFLGSAFLFLLVRTAGLDRDPTDTEFWVAASIAVFGYLLFLPLYHILMWSWWGQTVGMMAVRIRVVGRDGRRISLGRAAVRLIAFVASTLPLFLGLVYALFDRQRRALHDLLAGTVVIELP